MQQVAALLVSKVLHAAAVQQHSNSQCSLDWPCATMVSYSENDSEGSQEVFPAVGPFLCEICWEISDTKQDFVNHIKANHKDLIDPKVLRIWMLEESECDESEEESEEESGEEEDGHNNEKEDGSVTDDNIGDNDKNDAGDKETEERSEIEPTPGPSYIKRSWPSEYIEEEEDSEPKPKKMNHDDMKNYYYHELVDLKRDENYERETMDRDMQDIHQFIKKEKINGADKEVLALQEEKFEEKRKEIIKRNEPRRKAIHKICLRRQYIEECLLKLLLKQNPSDVNGSSLPSGEEKENAGRSGGNIEEPQQQTHSLLQGADQTGQIPPVKNNENDLEDGEISRQSSVSWSLDPRGQPAVLRTGGGGRGGPVVAGGQQVVSQGVQQVVINQPSQAQQIRFPTQPVSLARPQSAQPSPAPPPAAPAAPPASTASGGGDGVGGMGQQMTPDTAKIKCRNFLVSLLRLASDHPDAVAKNVRELIQGLIESRIEPEIFTTKLQKELNSSPQPCLVPFLKKSLPYFQHSLYFEDDMTMTWPP